ncbi:Putative ankyrin repeat protein MM_0045 [Durusdinium trenchii]|uniref:Ankyrin repeat protein MM_0045 n=2 Tax=Durusdinium trenchii TaxID=1381693 RepID=A0ABP0N7F3_9DINO
MVLLLWKPLLLLLAVALQKTALATERARELCSFDPVESDVPEKFYSDGTEMMRAAKCGDLERVKKLFEEKPDEINRQNSYGKTSLMFAVKYGAVKVGAYLIQKTELDVQDFHGMTALMIAVWENQTELAAQLIKHHAQLDLQSQWGWTALFIAAKFGNAEAAKLLVSNQASLDIQDKDGKTALMRAVEKNDTQLAALLLHANASEFPVMAWGCSAKDLARGNDEMWQVLESHRTGWRDKITYILFQSNFMWFLPLGMISGLLLGFLYLRLVSWHLDGSKLDVDPFAPGARLLASRTLVLAKEGGILINFLAIGYRVVETVASITLPLGVVMLGIRWEVVLTFMLLFYLLPAFFFVGFWRCVRHPALVFVGCRSPRQIRLKVAVTVTLLGLAAALYLSHECGEDIPYLTGHLSGSHLHGHFSWILASGPYPLLNEIASHVACPDRSVLESQKQNLLLGYLSAVWCLSASWVALALADTCGLVKVLQPAKETATSTEVQQLTEQICSTKNWQDLGHLSTPVKTVETRVKMFIAVGMAIIDMIILDLSQLMTWIWAMQFKFSACLICIFTVSMVLELSKGLARLKEGLAESMARGILRSDLVELLRVEQGLEAPLSLCLTSYAWIFSMYSTNFWLLMTLTIPSQLSSIYTVAMFGREIVDFDLDAAESLQLKDRGRPCCATLLGQRVRVPHVRLGRGVI